MTFAEMLLGVLVHVALAALAVLRFIARLG